MNGKAAKLLRKIKLDSKKAKRAWNRLTHIEKADKRRLVKNLMKHMEI
jgi:hypothetical protein